MFFFVSEILFESVTMLERKCIYALKVFAATDGIFICKLTLLYQYIILI